MSPVDQLPVSFSRSAASAASEASVPSETWTCGDSDEPEEEYEVGPFEIAVRAQEFPVERAQLRVRGGSVPVRREGDWFVLALDRLESHELIVLE